MPVDRRHDDFYEKFMEQRIQKINKPEQSSMEDSLPFPIEPLRTAPATLPQKRVTNTSSDSGVNSPHVLSPAMPITPDNSQPHLIPSTSRMNLLSGPLTPFNNSIITAVNRRTRNLNTVVPNLIILTHSLCFTLTLVMATISIFFSY